jgi:hypothetical protein
MQPSTILGSRPSRLGCGAGMEIEFIEYSSESDVRLLGLGSYRSSVTAFLESGR